MFLAPRVSSAKSGPIASTDRRERDDDAERHRRRERALAQEAQPIHDVPADTRHIELLLGARARRRELMRLTMNAENRNVAPSSRSGTASGLSLSTGTRSDLAREEREDQAPSGRVPHVVIRPREFASRAVPRDEVREARVSRRTPQQREAFDDERHEEDQVQLAEERHVA